jgi:branched-chain amino acid transport system permease protein
MTALLASRARHPVLWRAASMLVLTAIALVITDHIAGYTNYTLAIGASLAIVILGLSYLTGFSGQVSLGNGAFMAVGSYTVGIWAAHHSSTPIVVSLALSTIAGAAVGLIVGLPASRLRGPYLAGLTIAIALAFPDLVNEFGSWTNAGQGLSDTPLNAPGWLTSFVGGGTSASQMWLADLAIVTTAVAFFLMANLFRSRTGRAMRLMRENEVAAELAGISLPRARVSAFVVSCACAGLGGGLYTLVTGVVSPSYFTLALSIEILTLLVIGGIGTLTGSLIAGLLFAYSNQWIQSLVNTTGLDPTSNLASNLNGIIFGGLLIIFVLALPLGLAGTPRLVIAQMRRRRARPSQAPSTQ